MDTKELQEFITQFEVEETGDLLLGIFQPGMTVYNQQLRALNIFYAAYETNKIKDGSRVAIIGAGVAGLTFALAALEKNCKVDLFEKSSLLLPFQYGSDSRRIHPNFYNWPKPLSEYPYSDLPFFNWKHDTASTVSKDIYVSFKQKIKKYSKNYSEYRNTLVKKDDIERLSEKVSAISFMTNKKIGVKSMIMWLLQLVSELKER